MGEREWGERQEEREIEKENRGRENGFTLN